MKMNIHIVNIIMLIFLAILIVFFVIDLSIGAPGVQGIEDNTTIDDETRQAVKQTNKNLMKNF